ncbi:MAG: hypothetical protein HFACDABA_02036 [Anaerolineales bacterium]|nr:hypothetical protein [Anaerolineales bacterium]
MQLVVLAAGRGERLWPLTRNTPKCLLELANGMSVLDMQLQSLKEISEISEIIFVLGYLAEQVEAKLIHYANLQLNIRTVYNPFFAESNNLISLWYALPYLGDNFIVVNGDDVYDSRVPQGLVQVDGDKDVVMTIDRKEKYDLDDMKVITRGERVLQVGKQIAPAEANGESIGMIRFRANGASRFKEILNQVVRLPSGKTVFWLYAVQELINRGYTVNWYECKPGDWAEIDFHPDLDLVRGSLTENYAALIKKWSQRD